MKEMRSGQCLLKWDNQQVMIIKNKNDAIILNQKELIGVFVIFQEIIKEWSNSKIS